jgi:hypothetical protein
LIAVPVWQLLVPAFRGELGRARGMGRPAPAGSAVDAERARRIQEEAVNRETARFEKALQDIRSDGVARIRAGGAALTGLKPDDHQAEVVPILEGLLTSTDTSVRFWVIHALGAWGTRESIPKLEALPKDRRGNVDPSVKQAIDQIRKRASDTEPKAAP